MFSRPRVTTRDGLASRIPTKNPNYIDPSDLEEEIVDDHADAMYAFHKEQAEFDRSKLGFKSIFDQVPSVPKRGKVTAQDGAADDIYTRNPNFISAEDLQYEASGEAAQEEINRISAVNRAVRDQNYGLAKMLLGRDLTAEDLNISGPHMYYKSAAPNFDMYKTFDIRDVSALKAYLDTLDKLGHGYKLRTHGTDIYVVSGPGVTKDVPQDIILKLPGEKSGMPSTISKAEQELLRKVKNRTKLPTKGDYENALALLGTPEAEYRGLKLKELRLMAEMRMAELTGTKPLEDPIEAAKKKAREEIAKSTDGAAGSAGTPPDTSAAAAATGDDDGVDEEDRPDPPTPTPATKGEGIHKKKRPQPAYKKKPIIVLG